MPRTLHARLLAAASLVAIATGATPALAQDNDEPVAIGTVRVEGQSDEAFAIQPPRDDGYRAERAVTATRTETELRDVPQSITVVTRQQMDDQAIDSMADAVLYVPGVTFAQGEGNRDTPVFRGNATTADFYVDGIRDDVQYFRDVYNVERIEVLKGPNAMIFGRGGAGGVINRVTKTAGWAPVRELHLEAGSHDHYRTTFDLGQGLNESIALRLNGMWQDSESFRDGVMLERWGVNPTVSFRSGDKLLVTLGYEHFEDERTADRGIPSFAGRPVDVDRSTFFGDPRLSISDAEIDALTAALEYRFDNGLILRSRTRWADHAKIYQNVFPGAVQPGGTLVSIAAYNNATDRETLVNQTDFNFFVDTGPVSHTLLFGFELGRQETDNFRQTGYFTGVGPTVTSILVPVASPTLRGTDITFTQSATDADNSGTADFAAIYVQDQMQLTEQLQLVLGLRWDDFEVDFRNNHTGAVFAARDSELSPRVGLIFRPIEPLSLYASYTRTFLPRSGEQLSSLNLNNQALDPEAFENYEVGLKWDVNPGFTVTAALFQLDRSNIALPHPTIPGESILADGQRTRGLEVSAQGRITDRWSMVASWAHLDAEVVLATGAEAAPANTPENTFALWNRYDFTERFGAGLGVIWQDERFTSTSNNVALPSFTRVDAALFYDVTDQVAVQLNVENLLDEEYFPDAHSDNNISPGAGRLFRAGLTFRY